MPPEKDAAAYLWDMLDAARAVVGFVEGRTFREYETDRMLRNAVERNIEIIGEAAGKVPIEFRAAHPEINWRGVIGQRNVIAHDYGEIKHDKVWRVAKEFVPALVADLEKLMPPLPGPGDY